MRDFLIEDELKKTLSKLLKKDKVLYDAAMRKIEEILGCADVDHYKNLRSPLNHLKRVHIKGPYVLTFRYIESDDKVVFYDLDHHDIIYDKS